MFSLRRITTTIFAVALVFPLSAYSLKDSLKEELTPHTKKHISAKVMGQKKAGILLASQIGTKEFRKKLKHLKKTSDSPIVGAAYFVGKILDGDRNAVSDGAKFLSKRDKIGPPLDELVTLLPQEIERRFLRKLIEYSPDKARQVFRYLARQENELYRLFDEYLTSPNKKLRKTALKTVKRSPRRNLLDYAENMLNSNNGKIRSDGVALALFFSRWPEFEASAIELLESAYDVTSGDTKIKLARRLVELGYKEKKQHLVETFLEAPSEQHNVGRFLADYSINIPSDRIRKEYKKTDSNRTKQLLYELLGVTKGSKLISELKKRFKSTDFEKRLEAARALGRTGSKKAVSMLGEALFEGDERMRRTAADGLGYLGFASGLEPLKRALNKERKKDIKRAVIRAIGRIGTEEAFNTLQFHLKGTSKQLKREILEAMRDAETTVTVETIGILLEDTDPEIRMLAFETLYARSPEEAAERLNVMLPNAPMGFYGKLLRLRETPSKNKIFEKLVTHQNRQIRKDAMRQIERRPQKFLPLLRSLAQSSSFSTEGRSSAIRLLGAWHGDKQKVTFEKIIRNEGTPTQITRRAAWNLTEYATDDLEATFRGFLSHDDKIVQAVGAFGLTRIHSS